MPPLFAWSCNNLRYIAGPVSYTHLTLPTMPQPCVDLGGRRTIKKKKKQKRVAKRKEQKKKNKIKKKKTKK